MNRILRIVFLCVVMPITWTIYAVAFGLYWVFNEVEVWWSER